MLTCKEGSKLINHSYGLGTETKANSMFRPSQKYMAESITSDVGFLAWECGSMEDFEV